MIHQYELCYNFSIEQIKVVNSLLKFCLKIQEKIMEYYNFYYFIRLSFLSTNICLSASNQIEFGLSEE